ncbi:(deoxy)nucleoside triphosphate pyrophosphohydrolase [Nocardioides abyssi]|uniref:8-oxo-dGTP diphosphatase n=1 Tax=Nocardioides abyssi TaxID=3058370 RepID=A0ABT8EPZ9_9ACTN|nr:NUDIX domain-containing protein [Nocardioides abyssi]MDN4160222.1 NUDIX domain-containing protein [Nocardioides abyssi]
MRQLVVAGAVVRGGRVLAARRTRPPEAAGRWELPGGKVEPGERPDDALARELREELAVDVEVVRWLAGVVPVGEAHELRAALVRLTGEVDQLEPDGDTHDRLRWLGPDELDEVDWLEPDRPFLAEVAHELHQAAPTLRGVFFDEDDAAQAARRLRGDGYDAHVERERLAGEDDDEDHPWAVLTDAPAVALELLVDELDGWLDLEEEQDTTAVGSPLELPTTPRRIKRP